MNISQQITVVGVHEKVRAYPSIGGGQISSADDYAVDVEIHTGRRYRGRLAEMKQDQDDENVRSLKK